MESLEVAQQTRRQRERSTLARRSLGVQLVNLPDQRHSLYPAPPMLAVPSLTRTIMASSPKAPSKESRKVIEGVFGKQASIESTIPATTSNPLSLEYEASRVISDIL